MINIIFILVAVILIFIVIYRNSSGKNVYKYFFLMIKYSCDLYERHKCVL